MERVDRATDKYVTQLEQEGWCVMDGIIPADEVDAVREEVETSEPSYKSLAKSMIDGQKMSSPFSRP